MNLINEIQRAQERARVPLDTFGGRGCQAVFHALPAEAQEAWKKSNLPMELLISKHPTDITVYANRCGIELPSV